MALSSPATTIEYWLLHCSVGDGEFGVVTGGVVGGGGGLTGPTGSGGFMTPVVS